MSPGPTDDDYPNLIEGLASLIGALQRFSGDLHPTDILDALWIASGSRTLSLQVAKTTGEQAEPTSARNETIAAFSRNQTDRDSGQQTDGSADKSPPRPDELLGRSPEVPIDVVAPVYPAGEPNPADGTVKASPVVLPSGHGLAGRLALSRALRPFRRRWPSNQQQELDEERTAHLTAELQGLISPVFRPAQERWYDVDLVLEDDPVIDVWYDTLRDFSQLLRETGAFREVRGWRLRMPKSRPHSDSKTFISAAVESRTGLRKPARALGGPEGRRLVFFATHGFSPHWLNGAYANLLASWVGRASVVILHLFGRDNWKRSVLGDPQGVCFAHDAGTVTSSLRVERFWWSLFGDPGQVVPVPVVCLTPHSIGEWASMQMARGRRSPVYLVDTDPPSADDPEEASPRAFAHAVASLREVSPEAFRLAVYLCAGAFTLPVARLIQETKFGRNADHQHLAEVLLSGLVTSVSEIGRDIDPNDRYYEFRAEARAILLRSLREEDAESIVAELDNQVSRYIERIQGHAVTIRGLVTDQNGRFDLPTWAQPFARLSTSLLQTGVKGKTAVELVEDFRRVCPPAVVIRTALIAQNASGQTLDPSAIDPELWGIILRGHLVRQSTIGKWEFVPEIELLMAQIASNELLAGLKLLWVDDNPDNNRQEVAHFVQLGGAIEIAKTTAGALTYVALNSYDIIISDMVRDKEYEAGFDLLHRLQLSGVRTPVIIYAAAYASDASRRARALRAGAFGCTNRARELMDLIVRASGRAPSPANALAKEMRLRTALAAAGINLERTVGPLNIPADELAQKILLGRNDRAVLRDYLSIVEAFTGCVLTQLIRVDVSAIDVELTLVRDADTPVAGHVGMNSFAGRVASTHDTVWWKSGAANGPSGSPSLAVAVEALALPVFSPSDRSVVAILSLELDVGGTLSAADVKWLEGFCAPLSQFKGYSKRMPLRPPPEWDLIGELRGHSGVILRVSWHPQGRYLATSSVDRTAVIWERDLQRVAARLEGHSQGVNQVAWSPDATRLATCSYDRTIRIWSTGDWKCIRKIDGHTDDIPDVSWSPDGSLLASISVDRTVAVWDPHSGELKGTASRRRRGGAGRRVLWLENGQTLATCWQDGKVCLFSRSDLEGATTSEPPRPTREVTGPDRELIDLAYSPRGQLLATCSYEGTIRIWSWPDLIRVHDIGRHGRAVRSVSFSSDGRFLAANTLGPQGDVCVWDTKTWVLFHRILEPTSDFWPCNIAWSPEDYELATLTQDDYVVRLWDGWEQLFRTDTTEQTRAPPGGPILDKTDPQKGRWGGLSEREGRRVECVLKEVVAEEFHFDAIVTAMDGSRLEGPVLFHLHHTYPRSVIRITRIRDGIRAILEDVSSYGVFSVGVQVKNSKGDWIGLEWSLAGMNGLPPRFKAR